MTTTHASPSRLHIRQELVIEASRERVWWALTHEVSSWWHHRFFEDSTLIFEPRAGGQFAEKGESGEALFATIQRVVPMESLSMVGPMGMQIPCVNLMTYSLEDVKEGVKLTLEHTGMGLFSEEHEARYTSGWRELLEDRLKPLCEKP